jgi:hypothetical protein
MSDEKYCILNLTREDVAEVSNNETAYSLSEFQMQRIARKLGELYCETDYWETLKNLVKNEVV